MNILKKDGLFKEAQWNDKLPNILQTFLLGYFYLLLGQLIGEVFIFIVTKSITLSPTFKLLSYLIFGFIFCSLLIFMRIKIKEKRTLSSFGFQKRGSIKNYFLGFLIGVILMSIITLILVFTGNAVLNNNSIQPLGISAIFNILIILPGWIIQSATEEILTRGWIMNTLGARYTPIIGLIGSSVFFALLHLANPNVTFVSIINLILVGILFGLYVIKTKSLWGVCGMHAAWNFFQGNIFGFKVSGLDVQIGSIVELNTKGANWISGGTFGPEGGIICTVINSIAVIVLVYLIAKDNNQSL
ncbi:CPBP family intramembrane metalloprotease domain-containing protein [Clostridiaceae bacterium 14S0207]|nr:CPBP family intramembrane metalloprotease domain-containing protein [Clostridiaceae bacterium 14S0207]